MIVYFIIGLILHLLAFWYQATYNLDFKINLKKRLSSSIIAFFLIAAIVIPFWLPILVYSLIIGEKRVPI